MTLPKHMLVLLASLLTTSVPAPAAPAAEKAPAADKAPASPDQCLAWVRAYADCMLQHGRDQWGPQKTSLLKNRDAPDFLAGSRSEN